MPKLVPAEGPLLDRVVDQRWRAFDAGLSREAYRRFHSAQIRTRWGRRCQRTFALVKNETILSSADRYDLAGVLNGQLVRICGIGSLCAGEPRMGFHYVRELLDRLLEDAARDGAEAALLFSRAPDQDAAGDFQAVPMMDVTLVVTESTRYGAPMTMVRAGEDRDLAAIAAMGRARAEPFRFHLDRDVDFVQHAITTKRLLAGLGTAHARQLHFFIAEEGITAAAYVIVSVLGHSWTLEECGDRDPSGARVGALLQALIAREPMEHRPTIRAWLPHGFLPPQVTIASTRPSTDVLKVRRLGATPLAPPLSEDTVLFWRIDVM